MTTTANGMQPVAGIIVMFEKYEDFEPAWTYTDQAGRFALCGLPTNDTVEIEAFSWTSSLTAVAYVPPGQTNLGLTAQ